MNYIDEANVTCDICGMNRYEQNSKDFLEIGSTLNARYLVGKMREWNGEHILYVGKDLASNKTCMIKEYAPLTLSSRLQTGELAPKLSNDVQHKTFMVDFLDLHKTLQQLNSLKGLINIENIIICNKTVYIIYPDVRHLISLQAFLEKHWKLAWDEIKSRIFALNELLMNIHNNGVIHRGISAETILVDESCGDMFLSGFSIPTIRTRNTQVKYQLFEGYSAPEQYYSNKWQGEWTDVYSMACVLIKILTGRTVKELPPDFCTKKNTEADGLPPNVLRTIKNALCKDRQERTQTIRQFNAGLLAENHSNKADATVFFNLGRANKSEDRAADFHMVSNENKRKQKTSLKTILFVGVFVTAIVAVAAFFLLDDTQKLRPQKLNINEAQPSDQDSVCKLPNLVGEKYDKIKTLSETGDKFQVLPVCAFDEIVEEGAVVKQTPAAGTKYDPKKLLVLQVTVSSGPEVVTLPVITGRKIDELTAELDALGVKYEKIYAENQEAEEDVVYKASKEDSAEIKKNKETLMLYLKQA
jgi:serine/threonine-protein kinase